MVSEKEKDSYSQVSEPKSYQDKIPKPSLHSPLLEKLVTSKFVETGFYKKLVEAYSKPRSYNSYILGVIFDSLFTAFAVIFSFLLRFDFNFDSRVSPGLLFQVVLISVVARAFTSYLFKSYRLSWRHISASDLVEIFRNHLIGSLLIGFGIFLLRPEFFPRSIVVIEFFSSFSLMLGARLSWRYLNEYIQWSEKKNSNKIVIFGAGSAGHHLVKTLKSNPMLGQIPVAIFDDNEHLWGSTVHRVPVLGGVDQSINYIRQHGNISAIAVAIPSIAPARLVELKIMADEIDIPLRVIQSFEEIACKSLSLKGNEMTVEELLEREVPVDHREDIAKEISGKRVLITGAGGSIGSELVRQILSYKPSECVFIDQSEYNLFAIEQELRSVSSIADYDPSLKMNFVIADIVNKARLERIFCKFKPEIVFHAAAYKHVPLVEANCFEGFQTNVIGTKNLLELSRDNAIERFVLISTDKAVDPSSVMGATKRIAELLVEEFSSNIAVIGNSSKLKTAAVRFGNVINSSGSVIPTFKKQILEGKEITVTHESMTRYFMSIKQAVSLVLTAGTLGEKGEIYLLDMGTPLRIIDVAKKLRSMFGRTDIPIRITGLRPGEKLEEVLTSPNEFVVQSDFKKVFKVRSKKKIQTNICQWVESVVPKANVMDDLDLGNLIKDYACCRDNSELADGSSKVASLDERRSKLYDVDSQGFDEQSVAS